MSASYDSCQFKNPWTNVPIPWTLDKSSNPWTIQGNPGRLEGMQEVAVRIYRNMNYYVRSIFESGQTNLSMLGHYDQPLWIFLAHCTVYNCLCLIHTETTEGNLSQ